MNGRKGDSERRERMRCGVYTRKSTEEGLEQEFNSLDAQREAGEAYILSQKHQGWECLADRYDDGGFSGANMERPALKRLLADIDAGKIDAVVVYKVDRLSRSLLDFARMLEAFERRQVSFVSVTQQFNTATSMGRLILNVLLSFAQFERDMIAERTRDKMGAARRKGKWVGGRPAIGYDVDPAGRRLVVNEQEAVLVREVFDLYLKERSLLRVTEILNGRGLRTKTWLTRKGHRWEGGPWDKATVHRLLGNFTYIGKVEYRGEIYDGEQPAIVDAPTFKKAGEALVGARCDRNGVARNEHGFLLRGLIRCRACDSVMTSSFSAAHGKQYRYYKCTSTDRRGVKACPIRSVPAVEFERYVVARLRDLTRNTEVLQKTVARVAADRGRDVPALLDEQGRLTDELGRCRDEARRLMAALATQERGDGRFATERLGELDDRAGQIERRLCEIRERVIAIERTVIHESDIASALNFFDPVWDALLPRERARVLHLLIERIDYDGRTGDLDLTLSPTGVALLAAEANDGQAEAAAEGATA
jgi:site-specific DNA recombinase